MAITFGALLGGKGALAQEGSTPAKTATLKPLSELMEEQKAARPATTGDDASRGLADLLLGKQDVQPAPARVEAKQGQRLQILLPRIGVAGSGVQVSSGGRVSLPELKSPEELGFDARPGELYVVKPTTEQKLIKPLTEQKVALSGLGLYVPNEPGATFGEPLHIRMFIAVAGAPVWNEPEKVYVLPLKVGLIEQQQNASGKTLPRPVTLQVLAQHGRVLPASLAIAQLGPAGYRDLNVAWDPRDPQPVVQVASDFGNESFAARIERRLGDIQVAVAQTRVTGLGFARVPVTITLKGEDRRDLVAASATLVSLSTTTGSLQDETLQLAPGQQQVKTVLRSGGLGKAVVVASVQHLHRSIDVEFLFPTGLLFAALLGGGVGGLAHLLFNARKKQGARMPHLVVEGVVAGPVGLVLVAFMGQIFPTIPTDLAGTEGGGFIVAVLAGFVGTPLIHAAATKVGFLERKASPERGAAAA